MLCIGYISFSILWKCIVKDFFYFHIWGNYPHHDVGAGRYAPGTETTFTNRLNVPTYITEHWLLYPTFVISLRKDVSLSPKLISPLWNAFKWSNLLKVLVWFPSQTLPFRLLGWNFVILDVMLNTELKNKLTISNLLSAFFCNWVQLLGKPSRKLYSFIL